MVHKIPLKLINIDQDGYHLFIECLINGKTANMLVDTGASKTVFDLNRVDLFFEKKKRKSKIKDKLSTGLGTRTMKSSCVRLDEFEISGITFWNYQAILLDMSHVNQSYTMLNLPAVDGVIGCDILSGYKAVIDFGKKILKLKVPSNG
jgi:predicted aspartyl protease